MADIFDTILPDTQAAPQGDVFDAVLPDAKQEPGFMQRLGRGVTEGVTGFLPGLAHQAAGGARGSIDLLSTLLQHPSEMPGKLLDVGKGAARGLTLGGYQPESGVPGSEDLRTVGEVGATSAVASPLLGKIASPVARALAGTGIGAVQGGVSAGVQGGDVATGIGQGIGGGIAGEGLYGTARGIGYVAGAPYRQAVSKMAQGEAEFTDRMAKYGRALGDVQQATMKNKAMMQAYDTEVQAANALVAAGIPGAKEQLAQAIDTRNRLQADFDAGVRGAADQAKKLRPAMAPAQAYAEFNHLRDTAPQTLPDIVLQHTTEHVGKQANRILASSENLPRQAGIGAIDPIEKLAVGLDSVMGETKQANYDPGVVSNFGERWKTFSPEMKQLANEKYQAQIGISGDDIASLTSGRLRLDQFDRMRQLVGAKAGAGSGLASSIYRSLMEDLRNSNDPLAKGYIEANRSYGQNIAAMDLARMSLPARDKYGAETIDTRKLNEIKKMFATYDKDPKLLKFDERQIVDSIPNDQRQPFLDYIDTVFRKREAVDKSKDVVKETRKSLREAENAKPGEAVPKPELYNTKMPDLSQYGSLEPYPDMSYEIPFGFGAAYSAARAGGANISWSILAAHGLGYGAGPIFRLGLTPEGRQFARSVFMDGPPRWGDKAKLMAVQNFLQAQDFNEERKKQMRQAVRR